MISSDKLAIRPVEEGDRKQIANLLHFEMYVHRHLDWFSPLEWLGKEPFLVAEKGDQVIAVLACPPDPDSVAWIRLFASASSEALDQTWDALWAGVNERLESVPVLKWAAAIPLNEWFNELLSRSGYKTAEQVVLLEWQCEKITENKNPEIIIRPMNLDDLSEIYRIDGSAFAPLWQNSQITLEVAYRQAAVASVAEIDEIPVGYQISTATPIGGHLARLAVLPEYQSRGIGYALVREMMAHFYRRGAQRLTVNTQQDNIASLSMYKKAGFSATGESYPVYMLSYD